MVTAGVYLIVRSGPIFNLSATALTVVAIIGVVTLLFGAFIATAQDDFKRVLAGSTMSQIGYMVLAAGLGPAGAAFAIFHLLMHGFFKANLFLGAGSVMHAMNDRLDMRRFGGLRAVMPITFVTFLTGYLAIIGIPPFDGFYSKDKIIEAAFGVNAWYGLLAALGAAVTAYYMTRLVVMTFLGKPRWHEDDHPHDPGSTMWVPLVVLAILSTFAGFFLAQGNRFVDWLAPVVGEPAEPQFAVPSWVVTASILALVVVGAGLGYWQYTRRPVPTTPPPAPAVVVAARRDLYEDPVNETIFMRPGQWVTRFLVFFDNRVIDGFVNGVAAGIGGSSTWMRRWQTGFVRSYATAIFAGAALLLGALLLVRL
jgi:NADH-quinone oxidoreductase subunit L